MKVRANKLKKYSKEDHEKLNDEHINSVLESVHLLPTDSHEDILAKHKALKELASKIEAKHKYHEEEMKS